MSNSTLPTENETVYLSGKGRIIGASSWSRLMHRVSESFSRILKQGQSEEEMRNTFHSGTLIYDLVVRGEYREILPTNFHIPLSPGERLDWIGEQESDGLRVIQLATKTGHLYSILWDEFNKKLYKVNYQGEDVSRIGPPGESTLLRSIYFAGGRNGNWSRLQGLQITSNPH